jgi:acyl carrier protein
MTDEQILKRLLPLVREVTGAELDHIDWHSSLMTDLGAESLDLLDLSFLVEEEFGILLESDAIERQARAQMGGTPYEEDGMLTEAGLAQLKEVLPEIDSPRLVHPFRKANIPSLLTVGAFVRLIQLKLTANAGVAHA